MSEGLNRVMLLGNLGADPELRMTQSGTAVLNMRLAVNERRKDKSGEWIDQVEWVSVVMFGRRAEALHNILTKGASIFVDGSLRTSSYDDRDGNKRYKTEVMASNVIFADSRGGGQRQAPVTTQQPAADIDIDDIPF